MKSLVQQYLATGWKLCRISPGTKGPRDKEWNVAGHEIRTPEGFPLGYGVGLLHAWSGTMALDIDNYPVARAWLLERGVDLDELMNADDAVQIVSGRAESATIGQLPDPGTLANSAGVSSMRHPTSYASWST